MNIHDGAIDIALIQLCEGCLDTINWTKGLPIERFEKAFQHHRDERIILNDQNSALHSLLQTNFCAAVNM